jgi:T-complex protein 1 subunit beta
VLADNAGFDSSELVTRLRAAHATGESRTGLDLRNGELADAREMGVIESFKAKSAVLSSAAEAAEMVLRVDNIFRCAPRQRSGR